MTDHPITPPPELVHQWANMIASGSVQAVFAMAAQWGADQELEACCDHIRNYRWGFVDRPDGTKMHRAVDLELARRPNPPSLKEQALNAARIELLPDGKNGALIIRALEALPDD